MGLKCNVGGTERSIRFGAGAALGGIGVLLPSSNLARYLLLGAAAISIVTATTRYCPLNDLLNRNTCDRDAGVELNRAA